MKNIKSEVFEFHSHFFRTQWHLDEFNKTL